MAFPAASSLFSAFASLSASAVLLQTMINHLLPNWLREYLLNLMYRYLNAEPQTAAIVIEQRDGMSINEVYDAAEIYLCTKSQRSIERVKVSKRPSDPGLSVKFAKSETILDRFDEIELEWRFIKDDRSSSNSEIIDEDNNGYGRESSKAKQYFELRFDKIHRERVLDLYLSYIIQKAEEIKEDKKVIKLHTLATSCSFGSSVIWDSITLDHPSTFATMAMDPLLKKFIIDDLDRFVKRKEFYRRVGKAWKRGYLLYGPPGTGKSSLIAAMANYLKFDVYDLELGSIRRDSDLRKVLLRTANRSILVIEDVDCTVELPDRNGAVDRNGFLHPREQQFTLSGLLNFIDGLWSSCGDERIIVFTTNDKSKLDKALLRPGRMDVHVHMSYLTPEGFRILAKNYLDIELDSSRFAEIETLLRRVNVTPAEAAEELMKNDGVCDTIDGFTRFLNGKCGGGEDEEGSRTKKEEEIVNEDLKDVPTFLQDSDAETASE